MKNLSQLSLIILMALLFTQCTKDESSIEPLVEATILGEWKLEGFDNIRYHFTEDKQYRIYGTADADFQWPTLEEWLAENPTIPSNDWHYDGDTVVIDHHFGNISRLTTEFTCNNHVLNWIQENGTAGDRLYRVGHDLSSCN